jgi:hypothetical protein
MTFVSVEDLTDTDKLIPYAVRRIVTMAVNTARRAVGDDAGVHYLRTVAHPA